MNPNKAFLLLALLGTLLLLNQVSSSFTQNDSEDFRKSHHEFWVWILFSGFFGALLSLAIMKLNKRRRSTIKPDQATDLSKPNQTPFDSVTQMIVNSLPDRYESLWKISQGGMGVVFGAEDIFLKRKVAIKILSSSLSDNKEFVQRFVNEARFIASLKHLNILDIFDVGVTPFPYFVMEFLKGPSLLDLIKNKKKLSDQIIKFYGLQIAEALYECHQNGIIHRDIKPSNILLVNKGKTIKLIDFGIARDLKNTVHSKTKINLGSPNFLSPEQLKTKKFNSQSDIYAFGMTLYRLASGHYPFEEGDYIQKLTEDPFPLRQHAPHLDKMLTAMIMKCIEREPKKRFSNIEQVITLLKKIQIKKT